MRFFRRTTRDGYPVHFIDDFPVYLAFGNFTHIFYAEGRIWGCLYHAAPVGAFHSKHHEFEELSRKEFLEAVGIGGRLRLLCDRFRSERGLALLCRYADRRRVERKREKSHQPVQGNRSIADMCSTKRPAKDDPNSSTTSAPRCGDDSSPGASSLSSLSSHQGDSPQRRPVRGGHFLNPADREEIDEWMENL